MNIRTPFTASVVLLSAIGCLSVKTESEIKPIHITMDVNLKVDKELDRAFPDENMAKPSGDFTPIKALLERKVAGITSKAMLEAREGATDDDRIEIADANARKLRRMNQIAKDNGISLDAVQKRSAKRLMEKIPTGSGVWIQDEAGTWSQK